MKKILPVSLLALASFCVKAQVIENEPVVTADVNVTGQSRYFQIADGKKLTQYNLTLKGSIDISGVVTIHSLVQTGGNYNVGFNNIYNLKSNELNKDHDLYLKRLYLERKFMNNNLKVQAGAMGTRSSIATTNKFSNIGWIDGARAELDTKMGKILVTAGQIKSNEANIFDRLEDLELNYFEIAVSTELMNNLLAEAGVEVFEGKTFVELATNYDIEVAAGRILKLVGDAKVQTSNGGYKAGARINDLVSLIRGKDTAVKLSVGYEYVSTKFDPRMNILANGMHEGYTGGAFVMKTSFPVSKEYGLTGFTNIRVGNNIGDARIEVGIKKTIFKRKKKYKKRR